MTSAIKKSFWKKVSPELKLKKSGGQNYAEKQSSHIRIKI
jgi:hypothetical protein